MYDTRLCTYIIYNTYIGPHAVDVYTYVHIYMTLGTHAVDVHIGVIAHPPVALHAWPCSCSTQQCQWLLQQTK